MTTEIDTIELGALEKAMVAVKQHMRRTKSGAMAIVKQHMTTMSKKAQAELASKIGHAREQSEDKFAPTKPFHTMDHAELMDHHKHLMAARDEAVVAGDHAKKRAVDKHLAKFDEEHDRRSASHEDDPHSYAKQHPPTPQGGGGTKAMHTVTVKPAKGEPTQRYTRERKKLHDNIINHCLAAGETPEPGKKPVAILTGGGGGSGKGAILKQKKDLIEGHGKMAVIDADEFKEHLPEYKHLQAARGGKGMADDQTDEGKKAKALRDGAAGFAHEESSDLVKRAINEAIGAKKHFVYDGTMSNTQKYIDLIDRLHKEGYEVHIMYADLPVDEAQKRVIQRYKDGVDSGKGGRLVPEEEIAKAHANAIDTLGKIHHLADTTSVYSTHVPRGHKMKDVFHRDNRTGHTSKNEELLAEMHSRGHLIKSRKNQSSGGRGGHGPLATMHAIWTNTLAFHDGDEHDMDDDGTDGTDFPGYEDDPNGGGEPMEKALTDLEWLTGGDEKAILDLFKAIVHVKQHTRMVGGQAVPVLAHTRTIMSKTEAKDLASEMAYKIAQGKGQTVDKAADAHRLARHVSRINGRAVHVTEHPDGGFKLSHKAPPATYAGKHVTVNKTKSVIHGEQGKDNAKHSEVTAHLSGKGDRHDRPARGASPAASATPATPEAAAQANRLPAGSKVFGTHGGALEATLPASEIKTDAAAYQFKGGGDEYGVTGRLKDVKAWDTMSGMMAPVMLHQRRDGSVYVVDGHQRTGLARRLKAEGKEVPDLRAIIFREEDGYRIEDMRRIGSLLNIRQGTGTAMDVAKVLRDAPLSQDEADTIPSQSNEMYQDGRALSTLSTEAFNYLATVNVAQDPKKNAAFGAIVAREVTNQTHQLAILKALAKNKPAGKQECYDQVQAMKLAGFDRVSTQQLALFGEDDEVMSLIKPAAEIMGSIRRDLESDRSALGNALRNRARLESRGNSVNEEGSTAGIETAQALQSFLDEQQRFGGDFARKVSTLAGQLHRKEIRKHEAIDQAHQALEAAWNERSSQGADGAQADPATQDGGGQEAVNQGGDRPDGQGAHGSDDVRGDEPAPRPIDANQVSMFGAAPEPAAPVTQETPAPAPEPIRAGGPGTVTRMDAARQKSRAAKPAGHTVTRNTWLGLHGYTPEQIEAHDSGRERKTGIHLKSSDHALKVAGALHRGEEMSPELRAAHAAAYPHLFRGQHAPMTKAFSALDEIEHTLDDSLLSDEVRATLMLAKAGLIAHMEQGDGMVKAIGEAIATQAIGSTGALADRMMAVGRTAQLEPTSYRLEKAIGYLKATAPSGHAMVAAAISRTETPFGLEPAWMGDNLPYMAIMAIAYPLEA